MYFKHSMSLRLVLGQKAKDFEILLVKPSNVLRIYSPPTCHKTSFPRWDPTNPFSSFLRERETHTERNSIRTFLQFNNIRLFYSRSAIPQICSKWSFCTLCLNNRIIVRQGTQQLSFREILFSPYKKEGGDPPCCLQYPGSPLGISQLSSEQLKGTQRKKEKREIHNGQLKDFRSQARICFRSHVKLKTPNSREDPTQIFEKPKLHWRAGREREYYCLHIHSVSSSQFLAIIS